MRYDICHMTLDEIEGCFALTQDGIPIGQQEAPEIQTEEQEVVTQEEQEVVTQEEQEAVTQEEPCFGTASG